MDRELQLELNSEEKRRVTSHNVYEGYGSV